MGLFSSKTVISVASVVYNMAGEEKNRPNYLKSLVVRNVLSGTKESLGTTLTNGYLNGPALKYRSFFNWTQRPGNYDQVGTPSGEIVAGAELNGTQVEPHIARDPGEEIWVQKAEINSADISFWADQWILENRPADINTAYTTDYDETTFQVVIQFPDASTASFVPVDYDTTATYIFAYYNVTTDAGTGVDYGPMKVFIYRLGSGNPDLDALINGANYHEFYPFIPVRYKNKFLSSTYLPAAFAQTEKAYSKITGGSKIAELIAQLEDNESLGDIDNAYIVFGVSLNTRDKACVRYIYRFFNKLRASQIGGPTAYADWKNGINAERSIADLWNIWRTNDGSKVNEPTRPSFGALPTNQIRITGSGSTDVKYDVRLSWTFVNEGSGIGRGKPGATPGDTWIQYVGDESVQRTFFNSAQVKLSSDKFTIEKFRIYWQRTESTYTYLDVYGAVHKNYVYGGKAVTIKAKDALKDDDESGFIIPLHDQTWRETSIVDASQMATTCMYIVFNCYEVKKQKWYQSGIFKILFAIVIAIVSVIFTGGLGIGLLGAHLGVGMALGFSGLTAAIVGSIVNALAAIILSTLVEKLVGKLGPIGQLLGAIFMFFVGNIASSIQNGAFNFAAFFKIDNLIALTNSVGGGVANMMKAQTAEIGQQMVDFAEKAAEETKKIQQAFFDEFGYGAGVIDPFMFVDGPKPVAESSDTFLTRTLMTGSELAEMSRELLYGFSDYSLKLPDAFT